MHSFRQSLVASLVLVACNGSNGGDGPQGLQGPEGPQGVQGPAGPAGDAGPKGTGVAWKDASGATIPVVASIMQWLDTAGPTLLFFTDKSGLVWQLNAYDGTIYAATYATPYYVTNNCTGAVYINAMARWTYAIRGTSTIVSFADNAKATTIVPQSWNNTGSCATLNGSSTEMFAVTDGTVATTIPSGLFTMPVHPEYVPKAARERDVSARFDYDIGDRIAGKRGEYRVKQRLGAGGMGACYVVEDTDAPHAYVLKTMQSSLASRKSAREAFELEARGLIALHACPNIVHAFQLDVTKSGVPFYLMELLAGLSLREVLARKTQPHLNAVVGIGIGLASALVFAHDKQVVHCDVKPDNIFVVQRADGPLVKLLDFGVMKLNLVRAGYEGAAGTPAYMAPEQLRGENVDARSDLFAAGVVLYEMLAGVHPFAEYGLDDKGAMARIDKVPAPINQIRPTCRGRSSTSSTISSPSCSSRGARSVTATRPPCS